MSSSKVKYTNEPIKAKVISDFLPDPEDLAFKEEEVKVTLALSRKSVDFFKSEAAKHSSQYQRMIRRLLDTYVESKAARTSASNRPSRLRRARG
jgi:predicted DNA binding CopG/RHH family protein